MDDTGRLTRLDIGEAVPHGIELQFCPVLPFHSHDRFVPEWVLPPLVICAVEAHPVKPVFDQSGI